MKRKTYHCDVLRPPEAWPRSAIAASDLTNFRPLTHSQLQMQSARRSSSLFRALGRFTARSSFPIVVATLALAVLGVRMAGSQTSTELASPGTPSSAPPAAEATPSTTTAPEPPRDVDLPAAAPASARQLLVVQTANWSASTGTFRRYQSSANSAWELVGDPFPVNVGRNGMAWSQGLHAKPGRGPLKREGDGRSPAGIFDLEHAFGYAPDPPEGARGFPYLAVDSDTVCVEDVRSQDYNRILDLAGSTGTGWERRSVMLRADGLFRWGVVVSQNAPEVQRGSGSCVFLHVWKGPGRPTAGCTAMSADRIEEIVRWLDPEGHPSLVQLPEAEYSELRERLQLP